MNTQQIADPAFEAALEVAIGVYRRTHGCTEAEAIDGLTDDLTVVFHDAVEPGLPDQVYFCTPEETAVLRTGLAACE